MSKLHCKVKKKKKNLALEGFRRNCRSGNSDISPCCDIVTLPIQVVPLLYLMPSNNRLLG